MTDNPVLDYMIMRDIGWLIKGAGRLSTMLGATGVAVGTGGIGYGELQRRKINKFEDDRELVAAVNDTLSRQAIADIYERAGLPAPHIPLAVSKSIGSRYKDVIGGMNSKSAGVIRDIAAKIYRNKKVIGKFNKYPKKEVML